MRSSKCIAAQGNKAFGDFTAGAEAITSPDWGAVRFSFQSQSGAAASLAIPESTGHRGVT